jgi:hypothetical protein
MLELPAPGAFESLYVSPHPGVAVRSCAGRMAWERENGLGALVVVLFGETVGALPEGAAGVACGLPDAARRHGGEAAPRSPAESRTPEDQDAVDRAASLLDSIARRSGARDVYAPLGVGQQLDHCLSHEAALRAFGAGSGRNLLLYEETPQAAVPGAVRVRLASIGAQLPPGADSPRRAGILRFVGSLLWTLGRPGGPRSFGERLALSGSAARQWRAARTWRPQRAFGPRVQPVEHPVVPAGRARFWLVLPQRTGSAEAPAFIAGESAAG